MEIRVYTVLEGAGEVKGQQRSQRIRKGVTNMGSQAYPADMGLWWESSWNCHLCGPTSKCMEVGPGPLLVSRVNNWEAFLDTKESKARTSLRSLTLLFPTVTTSNHKDLQRVVFAALFLLSKSHAHSFIWLILAWNHPGNRILANIAPAEPSSHSAEPL